MKKIVVVAVFLFAVAVSGIFGQTMSDVMLNLRTYSSIFLSPNGNLSRTYSRAARTEDYNRIAALGGNQADIDTALEIAVLSSAVGVIQIRPLEANNMLGTQRQADLKIGASVFQEIQILRFLGNTDAVDRHKDELGIIISRKNVTEEEIEAYYRNGIRRLVSDIVDEEFGKPSTNGVNPVAVYADWQRRGLVRDSSGRAVNGIDLIKTTLTDFFLNPNQENYVRVRGICARVSHRGETDPLYSTVEMALGNTIYALSTELSGKLRGEFISERAVANFTALPNDPTFRIFEITYGVGGGK
jgi:hypothetical protein